MKRPGDFSKETIQTLSRRAALLCSNPDCRVLTAGPDSSEDGSTNIGEAAHIYGRGERAARHKPELDIGETSDITNGIWLCRNCHKRIDDDEIQFSAEILFEWRRQHEHTVLQRVGSKTEIIREKLQNDQLRVFENCSYLAQQIVLDKPPYWEYKLTTEILRTELEIIRTKWRDLNRGLYIRKTVNISIDDLPNWWVAKFDDARNIVRALKALVDQEFDLAWGAPGTPGNENDILRVCRLVARAAEDLVAWEEDVMFSRVPDEFDKLQKFLKGAAGSQIDEIMRIPKELGKIFSVERPSGVHRINLIFKLPDNFADDFDRIINRCQAQYFANRE